MTDAMSIAASGLQRYANDFLSSATRIVAAGGNFSEQDIVGLTEARIGFEASAVAFSDAAKMQDTLLDILV